jgi:hypothetical protein
VKELKMIKLLTSFFFFRISIHLKVQILETSMDVHLVSSLVLLVHTLILTGLNPC